MRTRDDLIAVRFEISCSVTLDIERIQEDPVWDSVCLYHDITQPEQLAKALQVYVRHYLQRESILAEMPSTCGPANMYYARFPGPGDPGMEKDKKHECNST